MADPSSNKERYTPPSKRNPPGNRKNTGGDRTSSQQNKDGNRSQLVDTGFQIEKTSRKIIRLNGCSRSEAYQLLSERWGAGMHLYNDPTVDLSERPIMYYGGSVWGKLPHQILASANNTLPPSMLPKDYTRELRKGLLLPRSSSVSNN